MVISQILNSSEGLVMSLGITAKEARAEIEIYPATTDAKIRKCSI